MSTRTQTAARLREMAAEAVKDAEFCRSLTRDYARDITRAIDYDTDAAALLAGAAALEVVEALNTNLGKELRAIADLADRHGDADNAVRGVCLTVRDARKLHAALARLEAL